MPQAIRRRCTPPSSHRDHNGNITQIVVCISARTLRLYPEAMSGTTVVAGRREAFVEANLSLFSFGILLGCVSFSRLNVRSAAEPEESLEKSG